LRTDPVHHTADGWRGLLDADDLIADLAQALGKAFA
jgi:hypothetical protein